MTGLGTALKDKTKYTQFIPTGPLSFEQLEVLYHENDVAALICDAYPEDALRLGFSAQIQDPGLRAQLIELDKKFGSVKKVEEAAVWARAYGGSVLYLGLNDGASETEPVNLSQLRSLDWVEVYTPLELVVSQYYEEITRQEDLGKLGKPKLYQTRTSDKLPSYEIHESRLIRFDGVRTSRKRKRNNQGWNESILGKINEVVEEYCTSWQALSNMMVDSQQAIFKIKNLHEMILAGEEEALQQRLEAVELGRSIARCVAIDADEEEFLRSIASFTGYPDIYEKIMQRLAQAARIPVTRLIGVEASGMNATGAHTRGNWYDWVAAYRIRQLHDPVLAWYKVLLALIGKPGAPVEVTFPNLWVPTTTEQAELEKTTAEKDKIYIDSRVVTPEEVARSRFSPEGKFNTETVLSSGPRPTRPTQPAQSAQPSESPAQE